MDGISQRMLTTTLRPLERDGFVTREVFAEVPPRVEYALTALELSLLEPMEQLVRWIGSRWPTWSFPDKVDVPSTASWRLV